MANIGIVVPTLGINDCLDMTLKSIAEQQTPVSCVVIVDQSNATRILSICRRWQSTLPIVHVRAHRGLSHARNIGISRLSPSIEIVGFLDDDCTYAQDSLSRVITHFQDDSSGAMSGRLWSSQERIRFGNRFEKLTKSTVWSKSIEPALFFRISALKKVGGFDEHLGIGSPTPWQSGEGTDLLLRVMAAGYDVHYNPRCKVIEHASGRVKQVDPSVKSRMYGRGTGFVYRRHYSLWSCLVMLVRSVTGACLYMVKGDIMSSRKRAHAAIGRIEGASGSILKWNDPDTR